MSKNYIDVRICNYEGEPSRVLGVLDLKNATLTITKFMDYIPPSDDVLFEGKTAEQINAIKNIQRNSVIVVDNAQTFPKWDTFFNENEQLHNAVAAFFRFKSAQSLILKDDVAQFDPSSLIERRKVDMTGAVYELHPEATNQSMCLMLACWAAERVKNTASMISPIGASSDAQAAGIAPFIIGF